MFTGPNIITDGLVLALDAGNTKSYPGSGTTWSDLSGNGNNGTLINGVGYSEDNGGSFNLDGINDSIQVPYSSYWDTNVFGTSINFTISCWAKPDLFKNWDTLISKANFASLGGWFSANEGAAIWSNANGFIGVLSSGVASNPGGSVIILTFATTNTERWYNLYLTGDGTTLRFYVDGIQRSTSLISNRTVPVTTSTVGPAFGHRAAFDGKLTNFLLYTHGITASEVLQNYNATKSRFNL